MGKDIIARGIAASVDAKLGEVPAGKTIMDLISTGGYDDTEIQNRIAELETEAEQINKDLDAIKALVGEGNFEEAITEIVVQSVSPLALSGNINDLTQDEGEYVTLTCGTSNE